MKVERRSFGDVTVLAFSGDFDSFDLPGINQTLDELIETGKMKFVFNVAGLRFINSAALGYMISVRRRLDESNGGLVLAEPSEYFRSTIERLGIDQIFASFATEAEAVAHFD